MEPAGWAGGKVKLDGDGGGLTAVVVLMGGCALDGFSEVEKNGAQHPQHLGCGL